MKSKGRFLFLTFTLGLGLTLALVWLLGNGLPARAASLTVDTTDDELNSDGDCSLREAIQAANTDTAVDGCTAGSGDDTITLPAGTYTLTIAGGNENNNATGDLDITDTLTIVGAGPNQTIINANGIDRVLDIQYGVSAVVISGVTIFDGYAYWESGGGIDNHWGADLTLINTVVLSSTAYAPSWSLAPGGGIAHSGGALTLTNVSILSNTAVGYGGGLYISDSSAVLSGTAINCNSVTGLYSDKGGGGLYVRDSRVTLHGGQIASNTSEYHGGGVHIRGNSSFTQTGDTLIAYNVASVVSDGSGGGVYVNSGSAILGAAQILSNTAKAGGGVSVWSDDGVTLSGTHIINNYAQTNGGGLSGGRASLYGVYILSNTANTRGGGISNGSQMMSVDATTLSGNRAVGDGGGVYNVGTITITNSTLSGNYATDPGSDGGALTNNGGTAILIFTTIVSNTTDRCGGGICVFNDGNVWMQDTLLAYNRVGGVITNCNPLSSGDHITSTGHNLEDADTCGLTATGDRPNTAPLLGPLADNGGDTLTHALLDGSPAIDAAACVAGITTDQRGQPRPNPVSPFCDIGAYESGSAGTTDLVIAKRVTPTTILPGGLITYTLAFTNAGPIGAAGVVITDIVPVSVTVQSVVSSGVAITDTGVSPGYVWQVQDLLPGEGGVITITGLLSTGLPAGVFTNSVTITSTAMDTDTANNSSAAVTTVTSVNASPTISDIPDQTTNAGIPVGPVSFTIGDVETPADALTLLAGSSNTTLVPVSSITFGGSGANRTVTITPTAGLTGTATITITVDDGSDTAGDTFVLTVEPFRIYLPLVLRG